jgi:hypothetical protein
MSERARWTVVAAFALAMAWVEAAVVFYLRTLVNRLEPYQTQPLPDLPGAWAELVRELATLVMLLTVGWLAGRTWRSRLGYMAVAFGLWDIFYYVFLRPLTGWPRSLLDWDILFLLPLPWWGPVLAPVLIALLLVLGGTLVSQRDAPTRPVWPTRRSFWPGLTGVCLALYVFMAEAIRRLPEGEDAVRNALPERFDWRLFLVALILMALPVGDLVRQVTGRPRLNQPTNAVPASTA